MTAILLGWNPEPTAPEHWHGRSYAAVVHEVLERGLSVQPWSVDGETPVGADVWLVLEGSHLRGLIGHGVVVGGTSGQIQVAFDALLPLGDQVPAEVLMRAAPDVAWDSDDIDGMQLGPGGEEAGLRSVWAGFGPPQGPMPTHLVPGTYPDEAVTRVPVNRYERDPEARRACIAHRGSSCAVCGFSFEVAYGEIGKDYIDVHHVVPLWRLSGGYQLDPLTDLVPLCANCHAVAHYGVSTPRTEAELRRAMAGAGFLTGSVVTPEEVEARRAARELLGPE
jgi:5-methylcytosine-specific restriction protein A